MKTMIRMKMKEKRLSLSRDEVFYNSQKIVQQLSTILNSNMIVASYMPTCNEVEVHELPYYNLCFPKVLSNYKMVMIKGKQFCVGNYGILEPIGDEVNKDQIDGILIPLLAYDKKGYRIGYGKGYYDRYLKGYQGLRIGVAYDFQEVDDAFPNQFDEKLDYIVTPNKIIVV